jgi:hypothetical protein
MSRDKNKSFQPKRWKPPVSSWFRLPGIARAETSLALISRRLKRPGTECDQFPINLLPNKEIASTVVQQEN